MIRRFRKGHAPSGVIGQRHRHHQPTAVPRVDGEHAMVNVHDTGNERQTKTVASLRTVAVADTPLPPQKGLA